MTDDAALDRIASTADIVAAYISNNAIPADDLPRLIETIHAAFAGLDAPGEPAAETYAPAVSVRKSLASRDHILSLIDGRPMKSLKRHLAKHQLTPDQYRARYNLPPSYPMVAPAYSEARSAAAKERGLGRKPAAKPKPKRGRKPRAKKG